MIRKSTLLQRKDGGSLAILSFHPATQTRVHHVSPLPLGGTIWYTDKIDVQLKCIYWSPIALLLAAYN